MYMTFWIISFISNIIKQFSFIIFIIFTPQPPILIFSNFIRIHLIKKISKKLNKFFNCFEDFQNLDILKNILK